LPEKISRLLSSRLGADSIRRQSFYGTVPETS
jgi:hypothetical protein